MFATDNRLRSLTVADAMSNNPVTINCNSTLSEAADVLCEYQITGAPVVNEYGKCVGVISGTDFIHSKAEELERNPIRHGLSTGGAFGGFCIDEMRHNLVRSHMSPNVHTVSEQVSLIQAARNMCRDHIHRLIVVDDRDRPIGILTSLDLVATLVGVVEE